MRQVSPASPIMLLGAVLTLFGCTFSLNGISRVEEYAGFPEETVYVAAVGGNDDAVAPSLEPAGEADRVALHPSVVEPRENLEDSQAGRARGRLHHYTPCLAASRAAAASITCSGVMDSIHVRVRHVRLQHGAQSTSATSFACPSP